MIEGVKIIERLGEYVKYAYKGCVQWCENSLFLKMSKEDFEKEHKKIIQVDNLLTPIINKVKNKKSSESGKALFERWQSEWGYDDEEDE